MIGFLDGAGAGGLDHGQLEDRLQTQGRSYCACSTTRVSQLRGGFGAGQGIVVQ